jgi:segregation and condensation protein A
MQQQIFDLLLDSDEVTWQSIIYKLVREEGMDPWDIDVSLLSKKYISMLKKLKEMDFRISGKVLLAAAIMLKLKSTRLIGEDMNQLDMLIASSQQTEGEMADEFYNGLENELSGSATAGMAAGFPSLMPRTPQPRVRKVSIYDLIESLEKALEVNKRRVLRNIPQKEVKRPVRERDIGSRITEVYQMVLKLFSKDKPLFFTNLLSTETKEEKLSTFVPLLHLSKDRRLDLDQKQHFGPIQILVRPELPKAEQLVKG